MKGDPKAVDEALLLPLMPMLMLAADANVAADANAGAGASTGADDVAKTSDTTC